MEWFAAVTPAQDADRLDRLCSLGALPALCADVYEVTRLDPGGASGELSCVWGVFEAARRPVRNGVRYELTSCPNALQWTVTTRGGRTTVHCSINTEQADPDFAESIAAFVDSFRRGLADAALADEGGR